IQQALAEGKINEGHTRPLMMLIDRPEEQETLFKEIMFKKLNVREAESIARHIAVERARKLMDPELMDLEDRFKASLGTRVRIEKRPARPGEPDGEQGGKLTIDFFSPNDLRALLEKLSQEVTPISEVKAEEIPLPTEDEKLDMSEGAKEEMEKGDEDLYSVTNFTV
ncbi:MAG: parB, partial [Parcubacteria group bacterium]|nr:parB [Parcubacteria group bacterium]